MNKIAIGIITALIMVSSVFTVRIEASTILYYTSSPFSWVGGGETVAVTREDGFAFFASRNYDNGVSFGINDFATNPDDQAQRSFSLDLAAPYDAVLLPGHYADATRFPFQEEAYPGLSFSGYGRGNNTLLGYFDVYEVTYGVHDEVLTFAADFVQYDGGFEDAWNRGSIRYNSDYPIPEPSTFALLLAGLPFLGFIWYNTQNRRTP
ncbi:MAG: PEP-CTERM sorting domain-containing protein [Candidatus Omnitrophota bacterium]|jgi:hypothetical protein